jgi:hypothetical protein
MPRTVSNVVKHAINAQQTNEVFIVLLTIDHPNFTAPIRVASDPKQVLPVALVRGVISNGEEFIYLPFCITLPQQDDTNTARATLSIDNIDREIVKAVRTADSAISVKIEIVLASDTDNIEISIDKFKLASITYDAFTVSGELSLDYYDLEPFPCKRFTPSDFPGMF